MSLVFDLIVLIITMLVCFVTYFKWKYMYWRNKNIPYIQPHIPFGSSESPFARKRNPAITIQLQYQYFKSLGHKFGGLYSFSRPSLLAVDIELIKNVMSQDFVYFMDRGTYYNEKHDPLSAHLFHLEGQKWRHLRAKLTPTFTSGKIKMMFPTLVSCADPLYTAMNLLELKKEPVDIKDILARFTTDVIGSCAFGLECSSFKEPEGDFRKYGKMILSFSSKMQALKFIIASSNPRLARYLGLTLTRPEPRQFFLDVVQKTVAYRTANKIVRNDFMQLLMDLKNEDGNGEGLTIEQIAAQAFVFFFAGFETSSTAMTFCLYELAINQDIQNNTRHEINTVLAKHDGHITYDAVMEMKYLNQVIDEALRKYPPGSLLPRECVQDYNVPGTDVIIERGTRVIIPIYALHHDPDYFPDPEKFDPGRFSNDERSNILPYTYMPFGEGPRICIGLRFGLLQAKIGLVVLLKNFKFLLNSKTKIPLKFDRANFILAAEGGVWLDTEKIS